MVCGVVLVVCVFCGIGCSCFSLVGRWVCGLIGFVGGCFVVLSGLFMFFVCVCFFSVCFFAYFVLGVFVVCCWGVWW